MAFPVRTRLIWRSVHLARFAGTDSSKQVRKSAHVWPAAGRGESINATTASNRERIASIRQPPVDVKEAIDAIEAETRILREEDPGSQFLYDPDPEYRLSYQGDSSMRIAHEETLAVVSERMKLEEEQGMSEGQGYLTSRQTRQTAAAMHGDQGSADASPITVNESIGIDSENRGLTNPAESFKRQEATGEWAFDSHRPHEVRVLQPEGTPREATLFPGAIPTLTELASDRRAITEYNMQSTHSRLPAAAMHSELGAAEIDQRRLGVPPGLGEAMEEQEANGPDDRRPLPNPNSAPYRSVLEQERMEEAALSAQLHAVQPSGMVSGYGPASTQMGWISSRGLAES